MHWLPCIDAGCPAPVLAALRRRVDEDEQLRQALEPLMDRLEELLR